MFNAPQPGKNDPRLFPKPLQEWQPNSAPVAPTKQGGRMQVEFEGQFYDFPDDATDDEIAQALDTVAPAKPNQPAAIPFGQPGNTSSLRDVEDALRGADAAGDTAAARTLADEIVRRRSAPTQANQNDWNGPTLEINGRQVQVSPNFLTLPREQQDATVDEINQSLQSMPSKGGTQRVEFEGQIHEFPADFTDNEIAQALDSMYPWQPPTPSPLAQSALNDMSAMTTKFDNRRPDAVRNAAYVGQRANRGIADVVGAPVDLMAGALNIGAFGADKLAEIFGGNFDARITNSVMGSDWIADKTSNAYEALGGEVVDKDDVSRGARLAGEATRFGVGAMLPSTGLASKTGQAIARTDGLVGRVLGPLAAPYRNSPSPMIGDAVAGAGSGAALAAYEDDAPEHVKDFLGPFGPIAAALLGGAGAATTHSLASGATDLAKNTGRSIVSGSGDPNAPINPATGKRAFSRSEMDDAARGVQAQATNPKTAAANIRDNTAALSEIASPGEMPSVGSVAEDVGLALLEREMRSKAAKPFAERDQAVNARAGSIMRENAPAGSTGRDFTDAANTKQRDRVSAAQANVDAARRLEEGSTDTLRQLAAPVSVGSGQGVHASQNLDEALTGGSLRPMQAKKNEAFASIDPDRTVVRDAQPLIDAAQSIRESLGRLNDPSSILPTRTLERIAALAEDAGGNGTITFNEINALRPELSAALVKAQGVGDFALADNIKRLQAAVNRETDLLAAEGTSAGKRAANAKRIYQDEFAPVWNPGPGDEATRFRRDFNADREGRTLSPPSATAGRFLKPGQPEKAASLQRIIESLTDKATANKEARRYLISDLAESGALDAKSQMLRYDSLRKWRDQ